MKAACTSSHTTRYCVTIVYLMLYTTPPVPPPAPPLLVTITIRCIHHWELLYTYPPCVEYTTARSLALYSDLLTIVAAPAAPVLYSISNCTGSHYRTHTHTEVTSSAAGFLWVGG